MATLHIVIPAEYKPAANVAAQQISPNASPLTFSGFGLSASGLAPATHYRAAGDVDGLVSAIEQLWHEQFPLARIDEYNPSAQPDRPAQILSEIGLSVINWQPEI